MAILQRHPGLRLAAVVAAVALILAAALGAAAALHWHQFVYYCSPQSAVQCEHTWTPGRVNPAALGICLVGLAVAAGVVVAARRSSP